MALLGNIDSRALEIVWWVVLKWRLWKRKENPDWVQEKWGIPSLKRPPGDLIWVHGASIGESRAALGFIQRLIATHPGVNVLITTVTQDAARMLKGRLPKRVLHQMLPLDAPRIIHRFLTYWKPSQVYFVESDFWPFLLRALEKEKIKTFLLNGRISCHSFERWKKIPYFGRRLLSGFQLCLTPSVTQIERLKYLGCCDVQLSGNLKLTIPPLKINKVVLSQLKASFQNRIRWFAANTHVGEETIFIETHVGLLKQFPDLLLFLAPRHIQRHKEIETLLEACGLRYQLFSQWQKNPSGSFENVQVILGDVLGNMGELYAFNKLVVMGGSFVPGIGGHNLLEPAQQGCCIVHGPFMELNPEIADTFHQAQAAIPIAPGALERVLVGLLEHPKTQAVYQKRAKALTVCADTILDEVMALVWH